MRYAFDILNGPTGVVTPLSTKGICLFNRIRIIAASTVLEDLDFAGRYVSMWERLKPRERVMNEMIMNGNGSGESIAVASGTIDPIAASDS